MGGIAAGARPSPPLPRRAAAGAHDAQHRSAGTGRARRRRSRLPSCRAHRRVGFRGTSPRRRRHRRAMLGLNAVTHYRNGRALARPFVLVVRTAAASRALMHVVHVRWITDSLRPARGTACSDRIRDSIGTSFDPLRPRCALLTPQFEGFVAWPLSPSRRAPTMHPSRDRAMPMPTSESGSHGCSIKQP